MNLKKDNPDLLELIGLCEDYKNNQIIYYLNINSLGNKIVVLKEVCNKSPIRRSVIRQKGE